jgi:hypothetical protein
LVGWTLPVPQVEGVTAQVSLADDQVVISVEADDEQGLPRNFMDVTATIVDPEAAGAGVEQEARQVTLAQESPGRYVARTDVGAAGTYLIRLEVREGDQVLGQQILGLAVPYSPEYRAGGVNRGFLDQLARLTGGGALAEPADAFAHNLPAADRAEDVWRGLLLVVALLFPLDVALRRVLLGRQDVAKASAWLRGRLPAARQRPARRERTMGQLWQARDRARVRQARTRPGASPPPPEQAGPGQPPPPPAEGEEEAPPPAPGADDALARLREAKERARRRR